ncbi:ImmA/IrrE family metallo-endopeptidase [Desulfitobacterium chlororespirans]|uniref:IrrE N-terminal-like domain-containing protein n=1 Tax=Desulfitobacterium chlororespirans DSM 11544 TaxID=1121395 RepID=A0A1M7UZ39_9FIRM|nr:ImmA/IrrE family metallo-endopeptidase [Desulfitobacterium chlororespirans]SHN88239.1 protein of unknown function [Desulfitobacterium chlororespirans DSM 11544]
MTKAELYAWVNGARNTLSLFSYPIDSKEFASRYSQISLEELDFSSTQIGGILKGEKHSFIGLNSCRTYFEQNFDCMYELFHFWKHPINTYTCLSVPRDTYLEWEANEGAAEMLVPYYKFIPEVCDIYHHITNNHQQIDYLNYFAQKYFVTPRVIQFRIKSLSYELSQYINGVSLSNLKIISKKHQERLGINVPDFSLYLDFGYELEWDSVIGGINR